MVVMLVCVRISHFFSPYPLAPGPRVEPLEPNACGVNTMIQTRSTKCQKRPTSSTSLSRSPSSKSPRPARHLMMERYTTPLKTWQPWNAVTR